MEGSLLFQDDFSRQEPGWTTQVGAGFGRWERRDGVCRYWRVKNDPSLRTAANLMYRKEGIGEIRQVSSRIRLDSPLSSSGIVTCWSYEGGYLLRLYYLRTESEDTPALYAELSKSSYASASFYDPVCPPVNLTALGLDSRPGSWHSITLYSETFHLRAQVDGIPAFDWEDADPLYRFSRGTAGFRIASGDNSFANFEIWGIPMEPSKAAPEVITPASFSCEDFRGPDGPRYWQFDRQKAEWGVTETGAFGTLRAETYTAATLHCFEETVDLYASVKFSPHSNMGEGGFLIRYAHENSGVKIGYSFEKGAFFIDAAKGVDFPSERNWVLSGTTLPTDTWLAIHLQAQRDSVTLEINHTQLVHFSQSTQLGCGRIGLFSDGCPIALQKLTCALPSGRPIPDGVRELCVIPDEYSHYMEFEELPDGTVLGVSDRRVYLSDNRGLWFTRDTSGAYAGVNRTGGYSTVHRLAAGGYLQVLADTSVEFSPDMKQWNTIGRILSEDGLYDEEGRLLVLFHVSSMTEIAMKNGHTRLFMPLVVRRYVDGRIMGHYTKVYYSDDGGREWCPSRGDTRNIYPHFESAPNSSWAESKVIRCSDGRLRMFYTRNSFGCICYTDSFDNGETFTGFYTMPQFPCAMSSFGIAEDPRQAGRYFLVYVKNHPYAKGSLFPRTHLVLLESTDGLEWRERLTVDKINSEAHDWSYDVNQILDPSILALKDTLYIGYGKSERVEKAYHNQQRARCVVIEREKAGLL